MPSIHIENLKFVNPYMPMMHDYCDWVFEGKQAQSHRGQWLSKIFQTCHPLHVEIGTGNGFHFANYAETNPGISLVGFEIKYKTAIQSIQRARRKECVNGRMIKGDARQLTDYFAPGEVSRIMIHFPDPWPKVRHHKNRLMQPDFFEQLWTVLQPGGEVEFKTDHFGYFQAAAKFAAQSQFLMEFYTENLHRSFRASQNYVTGFERYFLDEGFSINSFVLRKKI